MKTLRVHISNLTQGPNFYVNCVVAIPGLGDVEVADCVSQATIDSLFAEVAAAADLKLRGVVKASAPVAAGKGGAS